MRDQIVLKQIGLLVVSMVFGLLMLPDPLKDTAVVIQVMVEIIVLKVFGK